MSVEIKKGQKVYLSKKGHKGFFYPGRTHVSILYDVKGESVSWVGSSTKRPCSVPENALKVSGSPDREAVVWVNL